jgi:hypothetical protein
MNNPCTPCERPARDQFEWRSSHFVHELEKRKVTGPKKMLACKISIVLSMFWSLLKDCIHQEDDICDDTLYQQAAALYTTRDLSSWPWQAERSHRSLDLSTINQVPSTCSSVFHCLSSIIDCSGPGRIAPHYHVLHKS